MSRPIPSSRSAARLRWTRSVFVSKSVPLHQCTQTADRRSSQVIPLDSLCISPGKAVYTLYIDVVCINYDGNAFDAAVMAVMAALKNSRFSHLDCRPLLTWMHLDVP